MIDYTALSDLTDRGLQIFEKLYRHDATYLDTTAEVVVESKHDDIDTTNRLW